MSPLIPYNAPRGTGKCLVSYGETSTGKTSSVLGSIEKHPEHFSPALIIACESRNIEVACETVDLLRTNPETGRINYVLFNYSTFDELIETIANADSKITVESAGVDYKDIKLIFVDGGTQLMSNISFEIADAAAKARARRETSDKDFILRTKLSEEGYGSLADHMERLFKLLTEQMLHPHNKHVVLTMLIEGQELWDSSVRAEPSLMGKKFPRKFPGQVDFIGLVEDRYIPTEIDEITKEVKKIKKVYPPWIKFEEDFDSNGNKRNFLHKWTGKRPVADDAVIMCPFDLKTIFYPPVYNPSQKPETVQGEEANEKTAILSVNDDIIETEEADNLPKGGTITSKKYDLDNIPQGEVNAEIQTDDTSKEKKQHIPGV